MNASDPGLGQVVEWSEEFFWPSPMSQKLFFFIAFSGLQEEPDICTQNIFNFSIKRPTFDSIFAPERRSKGEGRVKAFLHPSST
jgi:hypothetical protein